MGRKKITRFFWRTDYLERCSGWRKPEGILVFLLHNPVSCADPLFANLVFIDARLYDKSIEMSVCLFIDSSSGHFLRIVPFEFEY